MRRLPVLARDPATWAYVLLGVVALLAIGNGVVLVAASGADLTRAAAGWFAGGLGLALAALVALSIRTDNRGSDVSVVTALVEVIVEEEEAAGRDVDSRFQAELPPLPARDVARVLTLAAALILAWIIALPWIGFGLATGLFCAAFMLLVSRTRLWVCLVAGAAIGGGLAALFAAARVLLPTGALWHLFL